MKASGSHFWNKVLFVFLLILFLIGAYLCEVAFSGAKNTVYEQYDKHHHDLALTIDKNVDTLLERCYSELSSRCNSDAVRRCEQTYIQTGNNAPLLSAFLKDGTMLNDYAVRLLAVKEDQVFLSSAEGDSLHYRFSGYNPKQFTCLVVDPDRNAGYIAAYLQSPNTDIVYYLLIDTEAFFRKTIAASTFYDYWFVLYDAQTGLTVQNRKDEPTYKFFTETELAAREDGYNVLYKAAELGEVYSALYLLTKSDNTQFHVRGTVLPANCTDNGSYSIGVFANVDDAFLPIQKMSILIGIAAGLIAISSAWIVFLLLHAGKKQKALTQNLLALEKENTLSKQLLDKQAELIHHQKLETIGQLTAGIAHEFNNLLTPIMGKIVLMIDKLPPDDEDLMNNAADIYEASERAKNLVGNVTKLSRKSATQRMKRIYPSELISAALTVTSPSIPQNVTVETDVSSNAAFEGDENQLTHLFMNLIVNSVQAMDGAGGKLTVSTFDDGQTVSIAVADNGSGIPEDILNNIFEPFFTTKEAGKGTGLGLAIVQNIVTNHHGTITAENLPQGGAKFTVSFTMMK